MKTVIKRIQGTDYTCNVDPSTIVLVSATAAILYKSLKSIEVGRGASGQTALLITRAAAGTLSSAAAVPTGKVYIWIDDDASDENGTTILMPGYAAVLGDTFTIPTANGTTEAVLTLTSTEGLAVGDSFYITGIGTFVISEITSTLLAKATNDGITGNTSAGGTASAGAFVTVVPATGPKAGRWMALSAVS
jgi:hypothetical protein